MQRHVTQIIPGMATADGDGVKLRRSIGMAPGLRHDPFLLLDEISSDNAADYIGGFPPHPHRGFETVTYMLEGSMQHKDHMGNVGLLKPNGAQWMTAGRGVIHEEMPQQEAGKMHGFQLWVNLPAAEKMLPADYQDIEPEQIAEQVIEGGLVRVIAGQLELGKYSLQGPINTPSTPKTTDPMLAEIQLAKGAELSLALPTAHNAFLYVFSGEVALGDAVVTAPAAALLSQGNALQLNAASDTRLLLVAGKPIGEPIAQRGPFVMNTQDELYQAMKDYGNGTLTDGV